MTNYNLEPKIIDLVIGVTEANAGIKNLNEKIDFILEDNRRRDELDCRRDTDICSLMQFKTYSINTMKILGGLLATIFCGAFSIFFNNR